MGALAKLATWTLEMVKRSDLAKGFEETIESAEARLLIASIQLFSRRIARARYP